MPFLEDDILKEHHKDAARLAMARWYNKVEEAGMHSFNIIAATFYGTMMKY